MGDQKPYKIVQSALIKRRCYIYDVSSGQEIGMVTAYNTFPIWEAWNMDDQLLGPCGTRREAAAFVYEAWTARGERT